MISLLLTFCLWECDKRSENGDWCGSSNANKANVRSSSSSTAGSSSPLSANCSEENLMASSTRLSRINSISCCCYRIDLVKLNRQIQTYSKIPKNYWITFIICIPEGEKTDICHHLKALDEVDELEL